MQESWRAAEPSAALLETEMLIQQNLSTRTELESWVEARKNRILEEKRRDQVQAQERALATDEAQRKREELQYQHQELSTSTHAKERELSAHQVEIEVLQAEKSKKEPVVKELFEKTLQEDTKLKQLLSELEEQRTSHECQLQELQQGLATYQRLGLYFEHTGADRVVVRFTQIAAQDPERVFSFRITIDPLTDRYIVDECNETLPSVNSLVAELNQDGDLALFIRSMRRQFKLLV